MATQETVAKIADKLRTWDGKEIDSVFEPLFKLVKELYSRYDKEREPHILLSAIASMAVSSSLTAQKVANVIKKEPSSLPKEPINELGSILAKLSEILDNRNKTIEATIELLVFAYENELLLSYPVL